MFHYQLPTIYIFILHFKKLLKIQSNYMSLYAYWSKLKQAEIYFIAALKV